jgi:propanol-preferring alcohol dehydrogenase
MKAVLIKGKGIPPSLETVPDRRRLPERHVARRTCLRCGATIHHARAGRTTVNYPRILGHEIAGEIVAVGAGVTKSRSAILSPAYFYLTCGHCHWCRIDRETLCDNLAGHIGRDIDGGYAEFMKAPARSFIKLPPDLNWREQPAEAGVICDAIATPVKVIRKARVSYNDTVAVFGAGGGLGLHMLQVARWAGAKKVIGIDVMASKFEACGKAAPMPVWMLPKAGLRAAARLTEAGIDVAIDFVGAPSADRRRCRR